MKKFTSMLAAFCLGALAASAAAPSTDLISNAKYEITPEGRQIMNTLNAKGKLAAQGVNTGDQVFTRSMVGDNGEIWNFQVLLSTEKICDMVKFSDPATGEEVRYGFDRLPYYGANFTLTKTEPSNPGEYATYIQFVACWPSYYIWQQIFDYEGELDDNGTIPLNKRNYNAVSMDDLANNQQFTSNFMESQAIGADAIDGTDKFEYWTLLENALGDTGACIFDGQDAQTMISGNTGSKINFKAYVPETFNTTAQFQIYLTIAESGQNRAFRLTYDGSARVEGFEDTNLTIPDFGDLHLFNAGLGGSAIFGDSDPFTENWGPYSQLFFAIGDEYVRWVVDPAAKAFSDLGRDVIVQDGVEVPDDENLDEHSNILTGFFYADPKYSNDPTLDPIDIQGSIMCPIFEADEAGNETITNICPVLNSFVPYGYSESWSADWGTYAFCQNNYEALNTGSRFGWGTTEGFRMELKNHYKKTWTTKSVGQCYYHYDPADVQKVRIFNLVGETIWGSGVETIAADAAEIVASNGAITVVPAENANVAVYSLDGACVKNVKANAGNAVCVNVEKGIYVVVVNGASKKVIL